MASTTSYLLPPSPNELAELATMAQAHNALHNSDFPNVSNIPVVRMRRRLSPENISRLVERYEAGEHTPALSREFGISRSSLCKLLRSEGAAIRRRPPTKSTIKIETQPREQVSNIRKVANV